MSNEKREKEKRERSLYREAAKRAHPDVQVSLHGNVMPVSTGAFVECYVWVPCEDIEATKEE